MHPDIKAPRPTPPMMRLLATGAVASAALLSGCASLAPDGGTGAVADFARPGIQRIAGPEAAQALARQISDLSPATSAARSATPSWAALLAQPLSAEAAVRIALQNNPQLQAQLASVGVSEAERVQAASLPNPRLALGRLREGNTLELERSLHWNLLGLLALPWRAERAQQQLQLAQLNAAQEVLRLVADTRRAWVHAVAAQQSLSYLRQAHEAAQAGTEMARRMAQVGNWSRLQHAREQALLTQVTAQLARAELAAQDQREQLTRLLGLEGSATSYTLPERLPDLPEQLTETTDLEAQALRDRLDVQLAQLQARQLAQSFTATRISGWVNALDVSYVRNTSFDNAHGERATKNGYELELALPLFDWGQSANARVQAQYLQALAQVRTVAVQARSEARQAQRAWRSSYQLARLYRDELVPLQRSMTDEVLLRYNGMLSSVWDVLAQARQSIAAVTDSIAAQRDFWLTDTDLQLALSGSSPAGLSALGSTSAPTATSSASPGH